MPVCFVRALQTKNFVGYCSINWLQMLWLRELPFQYLLFAVRFRIRPKPASPSAASFVTSWPQHSRKRRTASSTTPLFAYRDVTRNPNSLVNFSCHGYERFFGAMTWEGLQKSSDSQVILLPAVVPTVRCAFRVKSPAMGVFIFVHFGNPILVQSTKIGPFY